MLSKSKRSIKCMPVKVSTFPDINKAKSLQFFSSIVLTNDLLWNGSVGSH
jgi:hypothetical protein